MKNRWLCMDTTVTFSLFMMALGVLSNANHFMPSHFFLQGFRISTTAYNEVLDTVVKPWNEGRLVCSVGLCSFPYDPGMIGQQFSHLQDADSWFESAGLPYLRCHWQEDQLVVQNTKLSKAVIVDVMDNMNEKHNPGLRRFLKVAVVLLDNLLLNWTCIFCF